MSPSTSTSSNDDIKYTPCSSLKEELDNLRDKFVNKNIQVHSAATSHFVTWSYQRTPYAHIKTTLTFPEGYPHTRTLICDLASSWLPPGLKKKLERQVSTEVLVRVAETHQQVEAVAQFLTRFIDTNLFVPCWRELRQVVDRIHQQEANGSTIQLNDTKGLIVLRLQSASRRDSDCCYYYACSIRINPGYPSTTTHEEWGQACKLALKSTNFPTKVEAMLTAQAQELVRRMQDGMTAEDAFRMSNPIQSPSHQHNDNSNKETVHISQKTLKGLKHDIETLAHVRELRVIDAETRQGNATVKSHTAKERKDARRAIHKITKTERQLDKDSLEEGADWQQQERDRLTGYNLPEGDVAPQPSLLSLVTFLQNRIQRLPEEVCPVCQKRTLPEHPDTLQALYCNKSKTTDASDKETKERRLARKQRPIRTYCGCWYHYACLDKFMTEPPFGAACLTPDCGRRVYHPDWPANMKELERSWANRQARQREIEDAAMFL